MTSSIDNMTFEEIKELVSLFSNTSQTDNSVWRIGEAYFIRTVTMILTGRLEKVTDKELVLSDAAWIADTGRFADTIASGDLDEVEPYINDIIVGRGSIIDATVWTHALPREQK